MMYDSSLSAGFFLPLHVIAMTLTLIGLVLIVGWAIKYMKSAKLESVAFWTLGIGLVASVVTGSMLSAAFGGSSFGQRGIWMNGATGMPMMQGWQVVDDSASSASPSDEETKGKALFDKFQAKLTRCALLRNSEFELIGEYVMGQRLGSNHEQMNAMMTQMMSPAGETAMHVSIGKNATGCK